MRRSYWRELPGLLSRRPTLEVHVPISPTPSFLNQVRCLTHSLRRFGGAYRNAPVIVTVGAEEIDPGLAGRMPWLAANGIELRWVPAAEFAALSYFATASQRLRYDYRADVILLMDADTLIRRPLDGLIAHVRREKVLAGCIAHVSPLTSGKLDTPSWERLFSMFDLPTPRLEFEHTGWGYMSSDADYRYCPAYFNYGFIAAPAETFAQIGPIAERNLIRLREVMGSYYDAQIALALAIAQLNVPVRALPLRYNMPNNPNLEALHHTEVGQATVLHLLLDQHVKRVDTFASVESLRTFAARVDLRVVNKMAQDVIRVILPDLEAEERRHVVAA